MKNFLNFLGRVLSALLLFPIYLVLMQLLYIFAPKAFAERMLSNGLIWSKRYHSYDERTKIIFKQHMIRQTTLKEYGTTKVETGRIRNLGESF